MTNTITIDGRLARDPELKFLGSGRAVVNIRIGHTPRTFDKTRNEWVDGETAWIDASAWGKDAETVADLMRKGDLVLVSGSFKARTFEVNGTARTAYEIAADSIALVGSKNAPTSRSNPVADSGWGAAPEPVEPEVAPW